MSKRKLQRSLLLAVLFGIGNNISYATDYGPITGGSVILKNGDTVTSTTSVGVDSSMAGLDIQVDGAAEIAVTHTGSESKGVYLDNGAQNNLGSGTKVTVDNISGTSNLTTVGISVETKKNLGTGLTANELTVVVNNDKNVSGVTSSGSSNVMIDLGTKSDISATTTGTSSLVRAVDLSTNNTFKMDEGTITANGVNGQIYGIYAGGKADIQLGDQTTISANSNSGSANGIYLASSGSNVTANELQITGSGASAYGIYGKGNVDLGSGGKFDIKGTFMANGAYMTAGSSLKADGLEIAVNTQTGSGYGIYLDNSTADLGDGTSINVISTGTSSGQGIFAMGTQAAVVANELQVSTQNGYGLNIQNGAFFNGGSGSTISAQGNNQHAIWTVGAGAKFQADQLTLTATGTSAQGIQTQNGGSAQIGSGSHIVSMNGGGLVASSNSSIDFIGGATADTRNTITVGGSYGASAQQANTTVNLKNTDISVDRNGARAYALWAVSNGVLNAENVTVKAANGVYGIVANGGGKTNLSGETQIDASASNVAMIADSGTSWIKGTGKMTIGGSLIAQNDGLIDLSMTAGSQLSGAVTSETGTANLNLTGTTWDMTDDSNVTNLTMENSNVTFLTDLNKVADATTYGKLTITNLSGTGGTFNLRTDLENLRGDLIVINGSSSGDHTLIINNQASVNVNPAEKLVVVETADENAKFTLKNDVEAGGYRYGLKDEGLDWALYATGKATSTANASVNIFSGSYLLTYAETQTLLQRMGELRQDGDANGIWARVYGGKFTSASDGFLGSYDMSYSGLQVGADKKISLKQNKGNIYVGGMIGYTKGSLNHGVGSGSVDSKTLGVYGSYIGPTGFYTDLVFKYGWMKNDFKVLDTANDWVTGNNIRTAGLSSSLEIGQRIHFDREKKEGWYLEPQVQLSIGQQSGGGFRASNGLQIDVEGYTSIMSRVGVNAGYEIKGGKNPVNAYVKLSHVHEFKGDVDYRLNGSLEQTSYGDSWWTWGLGVTTRVNDKHHLYLDVERASGGKFNQPWVVNGGYRFSW